MYRFVPGQRWLSTAEPELGLGTLIKSEGRNITLLFATAATTRQYAAASAPLVRAEFRVGDSVNVDQREARIDAISERDGLIVYTIGGREVVEGQLDDVQSTGKASEKLIACRVDPSPAFDLRAEALARRAAARASAAYGVLGARIDLIPHQLKVASILAARRAPRALLADEVGLGKTIEACLALARLLESGRATRALVLVPEPLVYQWFVELKRRFNLDFSIFDAERIEAIGLAGDQRNPFEDEQLVLCDWDFLTEDPARARLALKAGWDVLIVDEAHHLTWSAEAESPEYVVVDALAKRVPSVLLLSATPEQLGQSGHFARLRLLDHQRFHSEAAFRDEQRGFVDLSTLAGKLADGAAPDAADSALLARTLGADALASVDADAVARRELLRALIDRHGTGRVMFRNRRARVGGFPERRLHTAQLALPDGERGVALAESLRAEFHGDASTPPTTPALDLTGDPRLEWLIALVERHPRDKFLLICRTRDKLQALDEALTVRSGIVIARFHEGLGIVQRDRAAAAFADPNGARLLIASEIGSEGRNFQFAQHLVLWDLPLDPDLLEQRIGRLDRIGQRGAVNIHVPAFTGSAQHALLSWYDEGLNAFRSSPEDGRELVKRFRTELIARADALARGEPGADAALAALIAHTRAVHAELAGAIDQGRDRLLELATELADDPGAMQDALARDDADSTRDAFIVRLLEHLGVHVDELDLGFVLLDPDLNHAATLPGLTEPRRATFDRAQALSREDVLFLRLDHPLIDAAIEQVLSSDVGNAVFAVDDTLPTRTALLECLFVLECVAPRALSVERFLPMQPIRVAIDSRLETRDELVPSALAIARFAERGVDATRFRKLLAQLVPPMLGAAEAEARRRAAVIAGDAAACAARELDDEVARLEALAAVNPNVRASEISAARSEATELAVRLPEARVRLDAVRFVASADLVGPRR